MERMVVRTRTPRFLHAPIMLAELLGVLSVRFSWVITIPYVLMMTFGLGILVTHPRIFLGLLGFSVFYTLLASFGVWVIGRDANQGRPRTARDSKVLQDRVMYIAFMGIFNMYAAILPVAALGWLTIIGTLGMIGYFMLFGILPALLPRLIKDYWFRDNEELYKVRDWSSEDEYFDTKDRF